MAFNKDRVRFLAEQNYKEYGKVSARDIATVLSCCYLDVEDELQNLGFVENAVTGNWYKSLSDPKNNT